jgi:hypothetical protein
MGSQTSERGKWVRSDGLLKNAAVSSEKQVDSLLDSDFHLVWKWTPLRKLIAKSKLPSLCVRRGSLERLIDAVSCDSKAAILAGLKETRPHLQGGQT